MKSRIFYIVIILAIYFFALDSYAQIEGFYPESNKYAIASACNAFGLFCTIQNSTPVRDSISISSLPGADLLFEDSTGTEHIIDSCYFIIIDTTDQFTYELWQIYGNTGEKFIIPLNSSHHFPDSTLSYHSHLQLLVKKENEIYDSSSHYFEMWLVQHIESEKPSLQMPDFSIKTQHDNTSLIPIFYTLIEPALVNMTVYSSKGQVIKTIINNFKCTGIHTHLLNTEDFSTGPYLIKFMSNKHSIVKRFSVLK